MKLQLRPYQVEALERIAAAEARGVRRQLGVAATGLGKTVMFCALAERRGGRTLVIAHRDELIEQAAAKVTEVWPEARVGVVKGSRNETDAHVVVASIQTLARPKRLAALLAPTTLTPDPSFDLVVVDEAHHAAAASYRNTLDALDAGADDGPLLLGVTATPDRGDGKGLDDLFDEVTFAYDIRCGINEDYLSDLTGLRVRLDMDLRALKVTRGDYAVGQAGQMLEDAGAPQAIVKAWCESARGRRTLVFTPTVSTAVAVADEFTAAGVSAAWVSGELDLAERRSRLAAYSRGDVDVMVNCMVLTEGYDEPRTDCIVVARPTKSRALYAQMVGRGTRKHPDKDRCLVIDVVGATDVHDLVTIPSLFGIEKPERVYGDPDQSVMGALQDELDEQVRIGRIVAAEAELFKKVRRAGIAWVAYHEPGQPGRYAVSLGNAGTMRLTEIAQDRCSAVLRSPDTTRTTLIYDVSLEIAQGVSEDYARKIGADKIAASDAPWRANRASDKQIAFAAKLGIVLSRTATKGEASEAIDRALAARNK